MALPPRRAPLAACLLAARACGFVPGGVVNSPHVRVPPAVSKTAPGMMPAPAAEPLPILLPMPAMERLHESAQQAPRIPDRVEPLAPYLERFMQAQPVAVPPPPGAVPSAPVTDEDSKAPYFFKDLPRAPSGPGAAPNEGKSPGGLGPDFAVRLPSSPLKASKVLGSWAALPSAKEKGAERILELMKKDLGSANPDNVFALTTAITGADIEAIGNTVSFEFFDDATGQRKKVVNIGYISVNPAAKDPDRELGPEMFRRITYWAVASGRDIIFTTATEEARAYYRSIGFDVGEPDNLGRSQVFFRDAKNPKALKDVKMIELELDSAKPLAGITVEQG